MSNNKNFKAFTLVELIVVITILAILATIGFVSFSGYLAGTRDTNRIAQLKAMSDALELYTTKKDLPLPDDKVEIKAGTTTIAYQGYIGKNVLETIEYTEAGLDPKDKTYFSYYLTKNKKYFQLLTFLEEENTDVVASNPHLTSPKGEGQSNSPLGEGLGVRTTQAADYSQRYPKVTGKKLGILIDENNTPIQEDVTIQSNGIDITSVGITKNYKAILSDSFDLSGSGAELSVLENIISTKGKIYNSCKSILESSDDLKNKDGNYIINLGANSLEVYCDMTTDGGGWTFFGHMNSNSSGDNFFEGGTGSYKPSREDNGMKYSLGVDNFSHIEMMATLDDKDPIVSDGANKIVFYKYDEGHLGFNKGPTPCQGLSTTFAYKVQIGGNYVSGGTTNACGVTAWYTRTVGNASYLALFGNSTGGNYLGAGINGTNSWSHDGWWYLR